MAIDVAPAGETTVRRAMRADAEALWPLVDAFAATLTPSPSRFDATFASVIGDPRALVLVAEIDRGVVGYLLAHLHPTFFADRPVVWVEEILVDTAVRRRGVGRALMEAVEAWAAGSGAAYVSLATRRAPYFYHALGYEDSAVFFRKLVRPTVPVQD